jgi:hypothetical protein
VKPPFLQLLGKLPKFYGIQSFITLFTGPRHWSLPWHILMQSKPLYSMSLRLILMLSSQQHIDVPNGLFPSWLITKSLKAFLFSPFGLHALPVSFSLTLSFKLYLTKSLYYEAAHHAVFSNPLLFHQCKSQIIQIRASLKNCAWQKHFVFIFVMGITRGPLRHVSINKKLLEWKSSVSASRKRSLTAVGIRCADHSTPSIRKSWH